MDAEVATKARSAAFMSAIAPGAPCASDRKRPLETSEIAAILNLHIRAPRLPLLDPSTRDLDLSTEDFPHAMRNGVRIVESRRWVSLTLQLKTFDRARRSVQRFDDCPFSLKISGPRARDDGSCVCARAAPAYPERNQVLCYTA